MAYIGREPLGGEIILMNSIESQFNGALTTFNLTRTVSGVTFAFSPISTEQLLVSLGGVIQKPDPTGNTGFRISFSTIIFAVAPPTSTSCFIISYGNIIDVGTPSDNTVSTDKLVDGSVTPTKLSTGGPVWDASSNLTVSGELRGPTNFIIDPSVVGDDTGTVEIKGNLTVQGTTTTINSTVSVIADPIIELRKGNSITAADGGVQVNLTTNGSGTVTGYQRLQWNNSSTGWETTDGTTAKPIVNTIDSQTIGGTKTFSSTISGSINGNAATVTTNANLTGHVTSVGNAAVLGSFTSAQLATALTDETGTGSAVFATSPTLVTPVLGAATGTSLNLSTTLNVTGTSTLSAFTSSGTTNDGTQLSTVTQSGTGTALIVTRTVSAATRSVMQVRQNSTTGGVESALAVHQSTPASRAITVNNDTADNLFSVFGNGAVTIGNGLAVTGAISATTGATFATTSGNVGIGTTNPSEKLDVAGKIIPSADNTYDLGSTTKRWANIYSADLQLSNEGSQNDVDGSWGAYTIQEGEDDLFLINRRNGKKYKFVLQEV